MAENNSGEKIEKKLKNKMLEDISINSKQPMAEISNQIYMNKTSLKKLSKSELINLLLKQEKKPKIIIEDDTKPVPARKRPIPKPRKSVKDMVQQYEDNIIIPPPEFRDDYKPIPLPRTKNHYKLLFQHQGLKNQFLKKELSFHKSKSLERLHQIIRC